VSDLAVVDRARIDEVCKGDDSLAIELIGMLLDEAAPIVDALGACVQSNDVAQMNELAHSLKGIAGNVGAAELRDAAARMQTDTAPDATPARALLAEELAAITSALERVRSTLGSWQTRLAGNTGIFAP
jgi:HPt (histidine-containing phosphotransfer) domain-containing protein